MPPISRETFQKLREQGYTIEQIAEAEKIRLGNEQPQPIQQPQQQSPQQTQQPNILQQLLQSTKNTVGGIAGGIIQPPTKIFGRAGQAAESMISGQPPQNYEIPLPWYLGGNIPIEPAQSIPQALGSVAQTSALMMGGSPTLAGAVYGAGTGMEERESGTGIAGKALLGGILGRTVGTMTGKYPLPTLKNEKLAGNVVNSLIKPSHKEFLFGKNPGQGIAKEGIIANSMDDLAMKVDQRISLLDDATKTIRNTPENITKTVNLTKIRQPLVDAVVELRKTPKIHSTQITNLENALSDLGKLRGGDLKNLSVSEAYNVKNIVANMQKWTIESKAGNALNRALKQVYHYIDKTIDGAIPELAGLNARMANLISAKQAIFHRIEILSKQEAMPTMFKVLDLPFMALKTPLAKTTLGKLLSRQYKLPIK